MYTRNIAFPHEQANQERLSIVNFKEIFDKVKKPSPIQVKGSHIKETYR